jgi:hypothetical protein
MNNMLELYEIDYSENDEVKEYYIIADNEIQAYDMYYFDIEDGNDNISADRVDVYNLQAVRTEYEFIKTCQKQLRLAKKNLLKYNDCLNDELTEYFDTYLK